LREEFFGPTQSADHGHQRRAAAESVSGLLAGEPRPAPSPGGAIAAKLRLRYGSGSRVAQAAASATEEAISEEEASSTYAANFQFSPGPRDVEIPARGGMWRTELRLRREDPLRSETSSSGREISFAEILQPSVRGPADQIEATPPKVTKNYTSRTPDRVVNMASKTEWSRPKPVVIGGNMHERRESYARRSSFSSGVAHGVREMEMIRRVV
jgi:hypothetical protein